MGICQWGSTLVTVALLLDPTFADVLVQPGYGQPGHVQKNSPSQSQSPKDQRIGNSQQNYPQQQNYSPQPKNYPSQQNPIQLLQQQHAYQQQYLQQQHQQEHQQLLQMQQQQLQNPALHQYQTGGSEVVGMPWGVPRYGSIMPAPLGGLAGGRLFTLGPLGLNSFTLGGLGGGLIPPLLMSPHQPNQMTGSPQYQKSVDGSTQPRNRREIRDPGESSGRKYRQKNTRIQQDGMATNSPLKSKPDATSSNTQTSKSNDDTVGSIHKENEENVRSSLLDPLGLVDKTEDFIDDLKSGHLPNPLNWLNKPKSTGNSQFEEHVVGESQPYQYPQQSKSNNEYNMMNQQTQQSMGPVVGDPRQRPCSYFGHRPQLGPFGSYPSPYLYRQSNPMNNPGYRMAYQGNPIIGASNPATQQFTSQTTPWGNNPMPLSQNSGIPNPGEKSSAANSNAYQQMIGAQNPAMTKPQITTQKTGSSGQSSPINSMGNDPIIGAPNPSQSSPSQTSWANPAGYNQMDSLYRGANTGQTMLGTLYDPVTGSAGPAALNGRTMSDKSFKTVEGQTPMVGNPLMNNFYDPYNRQNYYYQSNGGWPRHRQSPYDFDDIYDDNYHHHHHGGFDRIYEAIVDDLPFGYGGGNSHYMNNHHHYNY